MSRSRGGAHTSTEAVRGLSVDAYYLGVVREDALVAPANLFDLNPSLPLYPTKDITLSFLWDFLWRYDTNDAIYVPPGGPSITGDSSDDRFIGHSLSARVDWTPAPRLSLFAAYTYFDAGTAITNAGGKDVHYVLVGAEWSF